MKGDKVVALCDRNCNVIAPFQTAPGNRNESILLKPLIDRLVGITKKIGLQLVGNVMSLDSVYNSRKNRKSIFPTSEVIVPQSLDQKILSLYAKGMSLSDTKFRN